MVVSYFNLLSALQAFGHINFSNRSDVFCQFLLPLSDFTFLDYVLYVKTEEDDKNVEQSILDTYQNYSIFGEILDVDLPSLNIIIISSFLDARDVTGKTNQIL